MSSNVHGATRRTLRFGPFVADLWTRELRKTGIKLKVHGMPFEVLAALLERPGDLVTREELQERLWPGGTFVDFENSLNSAVARLREALNDSAENPKYIETLPKRGYRFVAAVEETTPEAVGAAPPVEKSQQRTRVAAVVAALLIVIAVGAFVWPSLRGPDRAASQRVMLAVLPFDNLSGDKEHDYLGDAFTEEVITQLARVNPQKFGVIARTTSMKYKGRAHDVTQVGKELRVDYVLEGSVRREGNQLRITAQLIRVADQTHLWAESFDREPENLLRVQNDVSEAVSTQIHLLVGPARAAGTRAQHHAPHPDAYEAYLRARYHHYQATVQGLESAIGFYRRAVQIDPSFALAYAGLARAYIFGVRIRPRDALEEAHRAAQKALELDPELPEAQLALAMTNLYYKWDWAGAEREFRRAIERDPGSADAHFYYSHYLAAMGRHDEAIAAARRAQQLDPYSPLIAHYVGRHFYMARRYEQAVDELKKALELDPNYGWTHVFLFLTYEKAGQFGEAVKHRQKYLTLIGRPAEEATALGKEYAAGGYPAVIERVTAVPRGYFKEQGHLTSTDIVHSYSFLGRKDEAFRWLDQAFTDHTRDLIFLNVEPGFDALRSDPRFQARLRQMSFPADRP